MTFNAVSRLGAERQYIHGGTFASENAYSNTGGIVGWYYSTGPAGREYEASFDAAALFEGEVPAAVEPLSADAPAISVTVTLSGAISAAAAVGVIPAQISDTPQTRYNLLRVNSNILGTIAAGSTSGTFSMTRAQAAMALAYGIKVFPASEFGAAQSNRTINVSETRIVYASNNPAARGRVSDLNPGNYSSIVKSAANTISYTYHHDAGGYAEAYLSVIASNQDTGEAVTICRKQSVSVADGARGSFTIPADTLGEGRWTLTVCAAPSASASYYADGDDFWTSGQTFTYVVRENPSSSSVTCDGKPVPTVSWTSSGQAAYQVRFGDYDSGARVGSGTSFTVPRIFRDGAYPVQVRTATSAGNWSAWTDTEYVEIANVEPSGTFSAEAAQDGTNAVLRWGGTVTAAHYAVFRDGEMIAVTGSDAAQFVDRFGAGGEYEVLAVTADRYYKSSGPIPFRLRLAADLISADGGYTWLACRLTPDRKNQPEDIREDVTYVYYAGSDKPAAFRTHQRQRTKTFSFVFFSRTAARALRQLVGQEVAVKTTRGEHIRGVIAEMSWGDARQITAAFSVREVRGEEDGLEYPA